MELVIGIGSGVLIGMYVVSQISSSIDANINQNKLIKNIEKYEQKKKTEQQESKILGQKQVK
jgi:hypothetical protein